jgi:hypothetical protein
VSIDFKTFIHEQFTEKLEPLMGPQKRFEEVLGEMFENIPAAEEALAREAIKVCVTGIAEEADARWERTFGKWLNEAGLKANKLRAAKPVPTPEEIVQRWRAPLEDHGYHGAEIEALIVALRDRGPGVMFDEIGYWAIKFSDGTSLGRDEIREYSRPLTDSAGKWDKQFVDDGTVRGLEQTEAARRRAERRGPWADNYDPTKPTRPTPLESDDEDDEEEKRDFKLRD